MKLAVAQVNALVGDLDGNARAILEQSRAAAALGAELVVFPELALVGYPPQDLLDEPEFISRALAAVDDLVRVLGQEVPQLGVLFGAIQEAAPGGSKRLGNAAVLACGGEVVAVRTKTLLPTYDVFDENRWFSPGGECETVEFLGCSLGITICEDIWNDATYWGSERYPRDPVDELVEAGSDIVINLAASPYHQGKLRSREEMMAASARRHSVPVVFANAVGGNDELIFDGSSTVLGSDGEALARARAFEADLVVAELDPTSGGSTVTPPCPIGEGDASELRRALVLGLHDYVKKCGFRSVVLGLSGGIDSAVVAALAAEALGPSAVTGVLMPSRFSSEGSVTDSLELAERLGISHLTLPIESVHEPFLRLLADTFTGLESDETEENIQARIRGTLLMALSNKFGSLVLSTGNKSELAVGYCTLYGDMNGGLSVLGDCYKGAVYELAEDYHAQSGAVPRSIITKPPSAELRPDQRDDDSLPDYDILDRILRGLIEGRGSVEELAGEGLDREEVQRIRRLVERNEYKRRQAPPVLRVTSKAFGPGRRLPLARALS